MQEMNQQETTNQKQELVEKSRKMATIRKISALKTIEGADRIELAVVDGWQVIVKKGEYAVGDLAIYCEVDSWVPHAVAPFLTKSGHLPKVYMEVEGQRLKSVKMKGQLSQGLLLALDILSSEDETLRIGSFEEGEDVTEYLGILKWEKEIPANLRGVQRGNFPTLIRKTDQERVQNLRNFEELKYAFTWEISEKMHGSSMTVYIDPQGELHVCSRNVDLVENADNTYWKVARRDFGKAIAQITEQQVFGIAMQGELIGPGINGNQYELTDFEFRLFDIQQVFDPELDTYCEGSNREIIADNFNLKHVPIIERNFKIPVEWTVQELLTFAEGYSKLNGSVREGLVFKAIEDPSVSFKVINNQWLLNGGEDQ